MTSQPPEGNPDFTANPAGGQSPQEQLGYQNQWQNQAPPQQNMPPQNMPMQQHNAPPPAQMGTLRVTLQGSFWTNSMVAPTVTLDGYRLNVTGSSGSFDFPVPAGQHRIHAHGQWMKKYGNADLDFVMEPGRLVEVFYAAPMNQFVNQGNIGFTPQKQAGGGCLIALLVFIVLIAVLAVALPMML
ncbi:hypothetical protein BW730_14815 [Tessaracoccus aquimaris]|uniref:Uncharacterized protein n=1 Tax=Tessaracoccus aquimaris TaxID=1332264 RepID=A0A1Q2CR48_9ACTN|nr:hypothetical protein [Tessaracoccus aquimaris]AQP48582.1 hypothetical protein BW730_14815 [Tessaracoccus aquimaris]